MLNDKDSDMLRNQLSNEASREHQQKISYIVEKRECVLISSLGLKPCKDGDQWCFLFGDNLQEGVCGFGDTPYKAMIDFNKNFESETISPLKNGIRKYVD